MGCRTGFRPGQSLNGNVRLHFIAVAVDPDTVMVDPDVITVDHDVITVDPDVITVDHDVITVDPDNMTYKCEVSMKEKNDGIF